MKKWTSTIIGVIIVIAVSVIVFATNKSSAPTPDYTQTPEPLGTTSAGSENSNPNTTGTTTSSKPVVTPPKTTPTPPTTTTTPPPTTTTSGGYTLAVVQGHNTKASCWSVINGNVYDLTTWIPNHPGGANAIINLCGKDGSVAFNRQHGGQSRPEATLATFKIGTLSQ